MDGRGYVTDVTYVSEFYTDHAPTHLNMIALTGGYPVRDSQHPFTWCDYGCGNGYTANVLAAANPRGTFYGVDFLPEHITAAQKLAKNAGLENANFLARSFTGLTDNDLPPLDYAVMHGVLSWVDEDTRTALLDEAERRIKPGGMVLTGYNTLPGWSAKLPLRDMMYSLTPDSMDSLKRVEKGLAWMHRLKDANVKYFRDHPAVAEALDQMSTLDPRYVAHEYFNTNLRPFYFAQLNAEMTRRGFAFAGSAITFLNMVDLSVPAELQDEFRAVTSRVELESKRDFIRNETFRRDVWIKAEQFTDAAQWQAAQDNAIYGTLLPKSQIERSVAFGDVELSYTDSPFDETLSALDNAAYKASGLCAATGGALPADMGAEAARLLCAGGQVLPFAYEGAETVPDALSPAGPFKFVLPFNALTCQSTALDQPKVALAVPRAGTGLEISNLEAICLGALCADVDGNTPARDPAKAVTARLFEGLGPSDTIQLGRKKRSRTQMTELIRGRLAHLKTHLIPKLLRLGVLQPL